MRHLTHLVPCFLLVVFLPAAPAAGREMSRDILGLRLEMPKTEVQRRLQDIGRFVRDERKRQQVWEVRDPSFSHLVVGFDSKDLLRYVTAVAREDTKAKRVSYVEVGDVREARQAGDPAIKNFHYQWSLPAEKGDWEILIVVRGRDPEFLSTYSLKRSGGDVEESD